MSKKTKTEEPSLRDMMFIAAEAGVDLRTVQSAYAGNSTKKTLTRERIVAAAKKIGLPLPPETSK